MIIIKSQEFLKDLYKFLRKQENQGVFVINFFNAAGCTHFVLPKLKAKRQTAYLENERHFAKDRSVLVIRDKFPDEINIDGMTNYLIEELKDDSVRKCMDHFGIPSTFQENKKYLAKAVACQFQYFLDAAVEDIDCSLASEYEKISSGNDVALSRRKSANYQGDDLWVEHSKPHKVPCYSEFQHEWVIHNAGTVHWTNRKLVLVNENKNNPRPADKEISIPDVAPNGYIKIATSFETRSIEGKYICEWEMQDSQGTSCFGMTSDLNVVIDVSYETNMED